ncbi:MAG TPA: hypothetical protein VKC60_07990 [Opitutaceae bacterium]|nr:hypothetical protein [Opitutaceae bacterium]
MKNSLCAVLAAACLPVIASSTSVYAQSASSGPYKVLDVAKVGGAGGFDYLYADADGRRLYVPRGTRIPVYDLDSLKQVGEIANVTAVHGAAVDPKSHHGFSSSKPVVMWDSKTLATIKMIEVDGAPDGIFFDAYSSKILILSHKAPNVTVIDSKDGTIVGTIDLGGAPEQAASDGKGHVYIDLEDKDKVAVVDIKALKMTTTYDLAGKGGTPAGLAIDAKNHILFVGCRKPQTVVVMNADDGKIITALPIGAGVDASEFNPKTKEAFSSQRDGTLTVIKENSPTDFVVEQTVETKVGAKTSTLDEKTGKVFLIAAEMTPPPPAPAGTPPARPQMVPDSFSIITVGK